MTYTILGTWSALIASITTMSHALLLLEVCTYVQLGYIMFPEPFYLSVILTWSSDVKFLLLHAPSQPSTGASSRASTSIAANPTSPQTEEAIKQFFQEIYENWVKTIMNPFYHVNMPVRSPIFRSRVQAAGKKYLWRRRPRNSSIYGWKVNWTRKNYALLEIVQILVRHSAYLDRAGAETISAKYSTLFTKRRSQSAELACGQHRKFMAQPYHIVSGMQ